MREERRMARKVTTIDTEPIHVLRKVESAALAAESFRAVTKAASDVMDRNEKLPILSPESAEAIVRNSLARRSKQKT